MKLLQCVSEPATDIIMHVVIAAFSKKSGRNLILMVNDIWTKTVFK